MTVLIPWVFMLTESGARFSPVDVKCYMLIIVPKSISFYNHYYIQLSIGSGAEVRIEERCLFTLMLLDVVYYS